MKPLMWHHYNFLSKNQHVDSCPLNCVMFEVPSNQWGVLNFLDVQQHSLAFLNKFDYLQSGLTVRVHYLLHVYIIRIK